MSFEVKRPEDIERALSMMVALNRQLSGPRGSEVTIGIRDESGKSRWEVTMLATDGEVREVVNESLEDALMIMLDRLANDVHDQVERAELLLEEVRR